MVEKHSTWTLSTSDQALWDALADLHPLVKTALFDRVLSELRWRPHVDMESLGDIYRHWQQEA
jgi:hypothetical protein